MNARKMKVGSPAMPRTLLIVDDEDAVLGVLTEYISALGYHRYPCRKLNVERTISVRLFSAAVRR